MLQKTGNKIDGVVAANDTIANSTISALKARKLDLVPTTGLDATAQAVQHILAGEQSMTVYFSIKDQATKAANLAVQVARGEKPTGVTDRGRQRHEEGADDLPQAADDPEGQHRRHGDRRRLRVAGTTSASASTSSTAPSDR